MGQGKDDVRAAVAKEVFDGLADTPEMDEFAGREVGIFHQVEESIHLVDGFADAEAAFGHHPEAVGEKAGHFDIPAPPVDGMGAAPSGSQGNPVFGRLPSAQKKDARAPVPAGPRRRSGTIHGGSVRHLRGRAEFRWH